MGNIVLLDDSTINKIAAGEVIERPASVVKEMLENSIDAGAKNITVEIKNGGISLIKISDDGSGIAKDDMELAFERHATSKIRKAEDLASVTTMGFRGEALASIAAISKVEMISKKTGEEIGNKIVVEGRKTLEFKEAARSAGTTITVQNLFFNTPVRYKFLKKDYTEAGYIEDVVNRIALVNLDVAIKLVSNGKTIVQTNGTGDLKSTIYSIYGKDISLEIEEVDYEYEEIRVRGVVGNPVIARTNRSNQLFFLNGRYIKDKNLTAATDQAYKGIVPVGRYGFVILNLQMDPKEVDVNVHPAKLEVRFEDESKVFKAVYHAIKSSLTTIDNKDDFLAKDFGFKPVKNSSIDVTAELPKYDSYATKKNKVSASVVAENMAKDKVSYSDLNKSFSVDTLNENDTVNKNNVGDAKKKQGIVGLFQKIIKEPEETEEEINNNYLEDIYNKNRGITETKSNDIVSNNITPDNNDEYIGNPISGVKYNSTDDIIDNVLNNFSSASNGNLTKTINEDLIKENNVKNDFIGTSLSSNTQEIDTSKINRKIENDIAKEILSKYAEKAEQEMAELEKKNGKIEDEKEVKEEIGENNEDAKWTQEKKDETKKEDETNNEQENKLDKIETKTEENIEKVESLEGAENTEKSNIKANEKNSSDEIQSFEDVAGELIKTNLDTESTQMIDTNKVREALKENLEENNNITIDNNEDENSNEDVAESEEKVETTHDTPEFEEMYKKTFGVETVSTRKGREKEKEELENKENDENIANEFDFVDSQNENVFDEELNGVSYKYIGIAFDSCIMIEMNNDLYIVNQNVASKKLMYEAMLANYYDEENEDAQDLLLPDVVNLSEKDMFIAKDNIHMFNRAGFYFSEFGENTIKLESVPSICETLNTKQLFIDIINELGKVAVNDTKEKEERFIYTIADKAASKVNIKLEDDEARDLINNLLSTKNPFDKLRNENVAIKMTKYDLERKFSRK